MEEYEVVIHDRVFDKIDEIQDFIANLYNYEAAVKYSKQLIAEIYSLSNPILVHAMRPSQWQAAKEYHPQAKRLITKNRKWNIIFHTQGRYVIVDAVIPSALMK